MSEGPGGPQGATAGGTLAMECCHSRRWSRKPDKRAANDKAIAQMLAARSPALPPG